MVCCCVPFCRTSHHNAKTIGATLHEFPCDFESRKIWVYNIHRKDFIIKESSRVCSLHFTASDYTETPKNRRLKKGAVPTVFPEQYPKHLTDAAVKRKTRPPPKVRQPPPKTSRQSRQILHNTADESFSSTSSPSLGASDGCLAAKPTSCCETQNVEDQPPPPTPLELGSSTGGIYEKVTIECNGNARKQPPNCGQVPASSTNLQPTICQQKCSFSSKTSHWLDESDIILAAEPTSCWEELISEDQPAKPSESHSLIDGVNGRGTIECTASAPKQPPKRGPPPASPTQLRQTIRRYQNRGFKLLRRSAAQKRKIQELKKQLKPRHDCNIKHLQRIVDDAEGGSSQAVFLLDQIKAYGMKQARWSEVTVQYCLLWQLKSPQGYDFPRRKKILCLPSRSTLKRYLSTAIAETDKTIPDEPPTHDSGQSIAQCAD